MFGQPMQPRASGGTVQRLGLPGDVLGKGGTAFDAVQVFKSTKPGACIDRNVGHAHLLPSAGALHTLGHVVRQAQFTSG